MPESSTAMAPARGHDPRGYSRRAAALRRVLVATGALLAASLAAAAAGLAGWLPPAASLACIVATTLAAAACAVALWRRLNASQPVADGPAGVPPNAIDELKVPPASATREGPQPGPPGLFEDGPVGIAIVAADGSLADSNAAFRALLADADTAGSGLPDAAALFAMPDGNPFRPELQDPSPRSLEVVFGADHGRSATVFLGAADGGRRVLHLIETTHQKKLELQFAQSQKMLAVGKLAGGIAHDFNNLLTAMTGFCDLLLLRHQPGDPSFADIMQIKHNANRAANLVRQLLAFSRQQTLQPRVMTLADVVADLSSLLRRLLGAGIELRVEHGADVCPVRVDRVQLEQVLINLAVNARDAMDGSGLLTIRIQDVQPSQVNVPPREPPLPTARWVLIQVEDSGPGIAAATLPRIFDPFFTTKPVGEGTGLGLSTVFGIVKQTDGYIYADNAPDGGARFSVYLPAHTQEVVESAPVAPSRADLTGAGSILLVEDEDPVRMFGARALRSKGYRVTEARTGQAALALLEREAVPFDLLITDVVMPELDGPALIEQIRASHPEMRVICISGYAESTFRDKLSEFRDLHFLAKPFTLQQLAGKVKEVMAAEPKGVSG